MPSVKIVCLGGGSLYFPFAFKDLVQRPELAGSEIVLYDLDFQKSQMVASVGKRLARDAGISLKFRAPRKLADALDGADFALSSIGGSGAEITANVYGSRFHDADIRIPAKYGVCQMIGDTCGPAGMMMALRSIPAYLAICREMEKRCPRAILFNHSNPMAVLMRAMHKYTSITAIGVCHGVQDGLQTAGKFLDLPPRELEAMWVGTNHYYWFTRMLHKGRDVMPELMKQIAAKKDRPGGEMSNRLSLAYGYPLVYAHDDHAIEFYPFQAQAGGNFDSLPYGIGKSGAALVAKPAPTGSSKPTPAERREFFKGYKTILDRAQLPPKIKRKEMLAQAISEEVGGTIVAISSGKRQLCIANIANNGAIPNLPATAEVEVEAITDSLGVRGLSMGLCPPTLKGILEKRFAWQELVADAAVTGDRRLALQALLVDEMAIWPAKASDMLDELLAASKGLLPSFFRNRKN